MSNVFGFIGLGCMAALFVIGMFLSDALEDRDMLWLLCALFGGTFLFLGLCAARQGIPVGWLFTAVGAVICICSLGYGATDADAREYIVTRTVPMLLLAAFVAAGAALLIIPPRLRRRDEERFLLCRRGGDCTARCA